MNYEKNEKLVVVNSSVLSEIILKVLDAKRLKACGEVSTSAEACRAVGISRSAYYKYKDFVFTYEEKLTNKIVSLYLVLKDEKGVLSSILSRLYSLGANILTVNQNIPVDSVASVTISIRLDKEDLNTTTIKNEIEQMNSVVSFKIISGE